LRPRNEADAGPLRDLALGLGVAGLGVPDPERYDGVASVLRGLRVLKLDCASALVDALGPPASLRVPAPTAPLLFPALVEMKLERVQWRFEAPNGAPSFFSRAALPSLRVLRVHICDGSDAPFELACLPPGLTRLAVVAGSRTVPSEESLRWPVGEPLLISLRSLASLAPTLRSLQVDCAWACGVDDNDEAVDARAPRPAQDVAEQHDKFATTGCMPQRLVHFGRLSHRASRHAPGLQLSLLTSLRLDAGLDFGPVEVSRQIEPDGRRDAWTAIRESEWRADARAFARSLAPTLRRLVLEGGTCSLNGRDRPVILPPSFTMLTALTCLEVHDVYAVDPGPLRHMTQLRRLVVWYDSDFDDDDFHPPLCPHDLMPLRSLEYLCLLWHKYACLAPVIKDGLPSLKTLVMRLPSRLLLEAAQARMRRDKGFVVREANLGDQAPLSEADLDRRIRELPVDYTVDGREYERHADDHRRYLEISEEQERKEREEVTAEAWGGKRA
jgi:hypothetical protein